jgi:DNA-binding GntR family transcriptional regulator
VVAGSCGNAKLASAIEDSLVLTSALRVRDVPVSGDSVTCGHEHVRVAEAISDRDGRAAADAMQGHVEHVMSMVLAAGADQRTETARS